MANLEGTKSNPLGAPILCTSLILFLGLAQVLSSHSNKCTKIRKNMQVFLTSAQHWHFAISASFYWTYVTWPSPKCDIIFCLFSRKNVYLIVNSMDTGKGKELEPLMQFTTLPQLYLTHKLPCHKPQDHTIFASLS